MASLAEECLPHLRLYGSPKPCQALSPLTHPQCRSVPAQSSARRPAGDPHGADDLQPLRSEHAKGLGVGLAARPRTVVVGACPEAGPEAREREQAVPVPATAAAGPSAHAAVPPFCEGDAGRTRSCSGRGASGDDAALASACGLPCDKLTALSRAEGRLTQAVEESACRTGSPERRPHGTQAAWDIALSLRVGGACGGIREPARPMRGEGTGQGDRGGAPGRCAGQRGGRALQPVPAVARFHPQADIARIGCCREIQQATAQAFRTFEGPECPRVCSLLGRLRFRALLTSA